MPDAPRRGVADPAPEPTGRYAAVAEIAARVRLDLASGEIAEAFRSAVPALERLSGASQRDILHGVRRSLRRWRRWLVTGALPADPDFDALREWARARASEGVRLEDLLRAFGAGRQVGWDLIRRHARADETAALLDAAELLMRYVDRVSAVVADTYLAERDVLVSEEERWTRDLLDRLGSGARLELREYELAKRLGVSVEPAYAPFAIVMPGRPPLRHAALAARLRRRGWRLTVTDGARVVGLAATPLDLGELGDDPGGDLAKGPDVVLSVADPTPRGQLAGAREDVVLLAEYGRRTGRHGRLRVEDHLLEVLLGRLPGPAARLRDRVLAPVGDADHDELRRTLWAFVAHDHDRAATSEALHIHRNTLAYRLRRITELTGLDLTRARDLAYAYLAIAVGPDDPPSP